MKPILAKVAFVVIRKQSGNGGKIRESDGESRDA